MDIKYQRSIEELLNSGRLNEWEQKTFQDIYERDQAKGGIPLSIKQKGMIDKKKAIIIDGITDPEEISKRLEVKTQYENCGLTQGANGMNIILNGQQIPIPTTKSEGAIILAWLNQAADHIGGGGATKSVDDVMTADEAVAEEGGDPNLCPF